MYDKILRSFFNLSIIQYSFLIIKKKRIGINYVQIDFYY